MAALIQPTSHASSALASARSDVSSFALIASRDLVARRAFPPAWHSDEALYRLRWPALLVAGTAVSRGQKRRVRLLQRLNRCSVALKTEPSLYSRQFRFEVFTRACAAASADDTGDENQLRARQWALDASKSKAVNVPLSAWVAYHDWVYKRIVGEAGCAELWHRYACAKALGLPQQAVEEVTGGDAADLLSCLAEQGLLRASIGNDLLTSWLHETLEAYDSPFVKARGRVHQDFASKSEECWLGEYDFIQLADPQLGMLHWDKEWDEELLMLRLSIKQINKLRPRFLLISGDLINAFPSGDGANPVAAGRQVASFKDVLRSLDPEIPIVLQPGNHDVGQTPNPDDVDRYCNRFGDDYFSCWVGGVFYISINSQYYMDCVNTPQLREAQDQWIMERLESGAARAAKHIVILSHVPPCMGDEDEKQGWSNWELSARGNILRAAERAGVKTWFCGHYHGNVEWRSREGMEIVVTGASGSAINWTCPAATVACQDRPDFMNCVGRPAVVADTSHSGLRVVRVRQDDIIHRWLTLSEVPDTFDEAFSTHDAVQAK